MNLNKDVINRLGKLSMFDLQDDEKDILLKDMQDIVGYVENLNELDLSEEDLLGIENPTPLREDVVVKNDVMQNLVKDFKYVKNGSFTVPQILE